MNILVTGGNSKLGKLLIPMIKKEHKLFINDRTSNKEFSNTGSASCDLTSETRVAALLRKSSKYFGPIEAVINFSGYLSNIEFLHFDKREFNLEMNANLFSSFLLFKSIIKHQKMISKPLLIINFSISRPEKIYRKIVFHNIAKMGLEKLTLSINDMFRDLGINTKCIRLPDMQKNPEKTSVLHTIIEGLLLKRGAGSPDIIDLDSFSP